MDGWKSCAVSLNRRVSGLRSLRSRLIEQGSSQAFLPLVAGTQVLTRCAGVFALLPLFCFNSDDLSRSLREKMRTSISRHPPYLVVRQLLQRETTVFACLDSSLITIHYSLL